jgi:hypothetical protein
MPSKRLQRRGNTCMINDFSPSSQSPTADEQKSILVDLGIACMNLGEWSLVCAIGAIIRARGLAHE